MWCDQWPTKQSCVCASSCVISSPLGTRASMEFVLPARRDTSTATWPRCSPLARSTSAKCSPSSPKSARAPRVRAPSAWSSAILSPLDPQAIRGTRDRTNAAAAVRSSHMRRAIVVAQLLALTASGCRNNTAQQQSSGGAQTVTVDPSPTHVVTGAECSVNVPDGRLCATERESCSGSSVSCASASPGEFAPCGGAQWQCQCVSTDGSPRWQCQQQMHAAGPLPPPELRA